MLTDAKGNPIATTTFTVCQKGHVNEAPQHANVQFIDPVSGERLEAVLCARCQFELFAFTCGATVMPAGTKRKEAEWRAAEMKEAREHELMALASPPPEERS